MQALIGWAMPPLPAGGHRAQSLLWCGSRARRGQEAGAAAPVPEVRRARAHRPRAHAAVEREQAAHGRQARAALAQRPIPLPDPGRLRARAGAALPARAALRRGPRGRHCAPMTGGVPARLPEGPVLPCTARHDASRAVRPLTSPGRNGTSPARSSQDRESPAAAAQGGAKVSRRRLAGEQDEAENDVGGQLRRVVPAAEARLRGAALEAQRAQGRDQRRGCRACRAARGHHASV